MSTAPLDAVIIGTGFAGIGMAVNLLQRGIDRIVLLEKSGDVGGVWRDNRYPGAACDVPSHLYSFSFAPNYRWSRKYAQQDEIHGYIRHVADQFGVTPLVRFHQEVASAHFSDEQQLWTVTTRQGDTYQTRALITAMGQLSRPAIPKLPGMEAFKGVSFHSAQWRHDVDLSDKRVAVVGTGASAIQFVPAIVPKVKSLVLLQRTPAHVIPKDDGAYDELQRWAFGQQPLLQKVSRAWQFVSHEVMALAFNQLQALRAQPEVRFKRLLKRDVTNPTLREKLTPQDPIGCKRILLSNDYFKALAQPHVTVVNGAIERVDATGITGGDGVHHEVDVIIYGTGFKAAEFLAPLEIRGAGGRDLHAQWQETGAEAYLGITVTGFPNLFMLYGPNTNLGHSSIILMLESQMHYIKQCVEKLHDGSLKTLNVRPHAQAQFNEDLQAKLRETVWQKGCTSWYVNEQGKNITNWPGFTFEYRWRTSVPDWSDYDMTV